MSIYEAPSLETGLDGTLVEVIQAVPAFGIGILIFIFGVIFLGGIATQKRRSGFADIPMWGLLASLATFLMSLMLTIKENMIDLTTLSIVVAVTILFGLWFFLSKGRGEI